MLFPKPPPLRLERARKKKAKHAIIAETRRLVSRRDRRCRICGTVFGTGETRAEMHEIQSRAALRGKPPHEIFTTANCILLCHKDHRRVTARHIDIVCVNESRGADGPIDVQHRLPKELVMPKRVDDNQPQIVDALRKAGASVQSLASLGKGVPDILIGYGQAHMVLCEIKKPGGKLNPLQVTWHEAWKGGEVVVLRSIEDALTLLHTLKGRKT